MQFPQLARESHSSGGPRARQLALRGVTPCRATRRRYHESDPVRQAHSTATIRTCLKDVLERLPTHPVSRIDEHLPHCWQRPTTH
jgi:hypothetical protein